MIFLRIALISFLLSGLIACDHKSIKVGSTDLNVNRVLLDSLDSALINISQKTIIPGFAVSIIKRDSVLLNKGYGYSDLKNEKKFTENTLQTIASISKTFIGFSIMRLVEDGKLELDEPINDILPFKIINPHFPDEKITIRHLVTHSSSINDDFDDGDKRASWLVEDVSYSRDELPEDLYDDIFYYEGQEMSLTDYVKKVCTTNGTWYFETNFSNRRPGEAFEYSNMGATIAALIVELKSGMPFHEFAQERYLSLLK